MTNLYHETLSNLVRQIENSNKVDTSKKMLIRGLEGQYMMMSGSALYLYSSKTDRIIELPDGLRWNETVITLRLPYNNKDFRYSFICNLQIKKNRHMNRLV